MKIKIRFVSKDDAANILEIYAPYVKSTTVTFETSTQRLYDVQRRIATISSVTPFLVCEIDGKIAGFAYANSNNKLYALDWNTNLFVYISSGYQRCNIASALYLALISLLKAQGYKKVTARVAVSDTVSEAFHLAFGFKKAGVLEKAAWKLGKWHDISIFEKVLDTGSDEPEPIINITDIDKEFCESNFNKCSKIIQIK